MLIKLCRSVLKRFKLVFLSLLIAFLLVLYTNHKSWADNPIEQQAIEDDWWLPEWVTPFPDVVGFYGTNPPEVSNQTLKLVTFRWRDVNPQEGVYDWSILEQALKQENNIYLRLENSDVTHCPDWLAKKYSDLQPLSLGAYRNYRFGNSAGLFYPMWHPGFMKEFKLLLQSFKQHQFGNHPHLKFAYIPGAWKYGEFDVKFVKEMEAQAMTPEKFLNWFQEMIDLFIDAFGVENTHKLMYTGHDIIPLCEGNARWQKFLGRKLFSYIAQKGLSTRFGLLEKYNFVMTDMPNYGIAVETIDNEKYLVASDRSPLIADPQRFIGSENEELGNENIPVSNYYQLKMTALKTLQVRANVVFLGRQIWEQAPQLHNYLLQSLGKHYYDSADAWCALRKAKDDYQLWSHWNLGEKNDWWINNFERWLMQREVKPNGHTVPVYYVKTQVKHNQESYEARRTDHNQGSDYIYFNVDDKFINGGSNKVLIKITYLDNNTNQWWLEYDSTDRNLYKKSTIVQNDNTGKWKTTTLQINDATFLNRQTGNMDFRIYNGGKNDLTVRFVRVIKLEKN